MMSRGAFLGAHCAHEPGGGRLRATITVDDAKSGNRNP
jgi:hypothetical protein